jgi:alpha-mannosidase
VLTQQFHDILPGSSIAWVHEDAERVLATVEREVGERIDGLLAEIAAGAAIVANPSDAALDEVVLVDLRRADPRAAPGGPAGGRELDEADLDTAVSFQRLSDGRTALRVSVPALGVAPFQPIAADDAVVVSESSMTNRHLAVRWDPSGNLTSIIDLATAREIVPTGELAAVLELGVDHPVEYDAWDLESWTRANSRPITGPAEVEIVDAGPLVARVRVRRTFGPSSSTVTYALRAGSRQLDLHVAIDWQHDEHLLSMAFPIDVRTDTATCDVQFGVVERPTHPSNPWDAAKFEVCAHRFVDLAEPDFGVGVMNDARFGHHVFDGAVRVSLARAAQFPDARADRGRHELQLAIRPHGAGLADVLASSSRLNAPVRVVWASDPAVPPEPPALVPGVPLVPLVAVTGADGMPAAGVRIDAVKLADDASGEVIVRLHEAVGNRTRISVGGRDRIVEAWRCNLLEEPSIGEEVSDGVVALTLRPFQLATLRLRCGPRADGRSLRE